MQDNPFNRIDAPGFTSEATTFGLKVLDKLNLFDNDDIVAAFPFGKAIQGTWKLLKNYSDPHKAARHSVGKAVGICFGAGLLEYGIEAMKLSPRDEELMAAALEEAREKAAVDLPTFKVNSIHETETAQRFIEIYFQYFNRSTVAQKEIYEPRLRKFLRVWLTLFWRRLLDRHPDTYKVLLDHLKQESFQLEQRIKAQLQYEAMLANMYLQPVQNNPKIRLSDMYIMPRCEVLESLCMEGRVSHVGESKFWACENARLPEELHKLVQLWLTGDLDYSWLYGDNQRLLLLYGMPGQGKTSFCKRLLHELISENKREGRPVYFLRLRRVRELGQLKATLLPYIIQMIEEYNGINITKRDLHSAILILDGMDELAMSANLTMHETDSVLLELLNSVRHIEGIHLIVTSRHGYIRNDRQLSDMLILQLKQLEEDQQIQWIRRYRLLKPEHILTEAAFARLDQRSPLWELINQPILLQMVADLETIPESIADRADLYQLFFDHIVRTPWKEGGKNIQALAKLGEKKA
jgi:hypothetical protein